MNTMAVIMDNYAKYVVLVLQAHNSSNYGTSI